MLVILSSDDKELELQTGTPVNGIELHRGFEYQERNWYSRTESLGHVLLLEKRFLCLGSIYIFEDGKSNHPLQRQNISKYTANAFTFK